MPLSSDTHKTNPTEDRLNFAPFAKRLAESIEKMVPPQGLVIGIYGQWGSGKSTMIAFIRGYLEQSTSTPQPITVNFNPWWFSGTEYLLRSFFETLHTALGNERGKHLQAAVEGIRSISNIVAEIPLPGAKIPKAIADEIPNISTQNIDVLKQRVSKALESSKRRIVIFIDDIDRLNPDEIRQLFTVIKSVTNFPNVVYVLSFDKKIVSEAFGVNGFEYLEKIVQVPFNLPVPSQKHLERLFLSELEEIVGTLPKELSHDFWGLRTASSTITNILNTPRKIVRLLNTFRVIYAGLHEETYILDLLYLEIIRVFYPDLYQYIGAKSEFFVGDNVSLEELKHFKWIISRLGDDSPFVEILLKELFPKFDSSVPVYGSNPYREAEARSQLRIRSKARFLVYFQFALVENQVSQPELQTILSSINDAKELAAKVLDFSRFNPGKLESLLRSIFDIAHQRSVNDIAILEALLSVSDQIVEPKDSTPRPIEGTFRLITFYLLQRLNRQQDFEAVVSILSRTNSCFAIRLLDTILHREGEYPSGANSYVVIYSSEQLKTLENTAIALLKNIREAAGIIPIDEVITTISRWNAQQPSEAHNWLMEMFKNPENLYDFIKMFQIHNSRRDEIKIDKEIEDFIQLNEIAHLLETYLLNREYDTDKLSYLERFLTLARNNPE